MKLTSIRTGRRRPFLEIELHSENQEIVFPEGLKVIREVTDDPAYSNRAMARISNG